MRAVLHSRRACLAASSTLSTQCSSSARLVLLPWVQRRTKWSISNLFGRGGRGAGSVDPSHSTTGGQNLDDPKVRAQLIAEHQQKQHHAAPSLSDSIFEDEVAAATRAGARKPGQELEEEESTRPPPPESLLWRLDPDPRSRVRWERKKVIQLVRRQTSGEELPDHVKRAERIALTERQITHKSPFLETSTKKLVMLARQIQGKSLDEALLQMTFSKKKMAAEVKFHLEEARDMAVVSRGMGLGKAKKGSQESATPIKIRTKDGKTLEVNDPTRLYIAQAWVGRGPIRQYRMDYKGRGRHGIIASPSTSISVIVKEEKTRIREHDEAVAREAKRKPWVHLPNRPVTAQRPYYSW